MSNVGFMFTNLVQQEDGCFGAYAPHSLLQMRAKIWNILRFRIGPWELELGERCMNLIVELKRNEPQVRRKTLDDLVPLSIAFVVGTIIPRTVSATFGFNFSDVDLAKGPFEALNAVQEALKMAS